ncbi:hypothetical protein [Microvirga vignae]|nr:hypothetical protein [Microvirga vignae]
MRQSRQWHELVVIIILGPLIGLGLGLLAAKAGPSLTETNAPPTILNQD